MKKVVLGMAFVVAMSLSVGVNAQDTKTKKEAAKTETCCKKEAATCDKKSEGCCAKADKKCCENADKKECAKKDAAKTGSCCKKETTACDKKKSGDCCADAAKKKSAKKSDKK